MRVQDRHLQGGLFAAALVLSCGNPAAQVDRTFSGTASTLVLSDSTATADGVATVTATATARDAKGKPFAGLRVTFSATGSSNTWTPPFATSGADGTATARLSSTKAEQKSVTAAVGTVALGQAQMVTFKGSPATSARFSAGPAPATAGATLAAVQVAIADAGGNAASGTVALTLAAAPAAATLGGTTSVDAVDGVASFTDLVIKKAGAGYVLRATIGVVTVDSAAFAIGPTAAAALAFSIQPASTAAGQAFGATVIISDAHGNPTPSTASVTVRLGNPGGATLRGTLARAAVAGAAVFDDLAVREAKAGYTLVAGSAGLPETTSASFDVAPGAAARLSFTVHPSDAVAGATLSPAVKIAAVDGFGNKVTGSGLAVTVALASGPAGAVLNGARTVATTAGESSFTDLAVEKAGAGYTLGASASGLDPATSSSFAVTAADPSPAHCTLAATPASVVADDSSTATVTVTIRDRFGNPVAGRSPTIAASGTNNTLAQPAASDASGAAVGSLKSKTAQPKTITATLGGASIPGSASVTFKAGDVDGPVSTLDAGAGPVVADGVATSTATATVLDKFGNPIQGATVTFAATGSANAWTPGSASSGDDGVATATLASTKAEGKSITASVGTTALGVARPVTFKAGGANTAKSKLEVSTTSLTADNVATVTATATAKDANDNPIGGATVTFEATGSANTWTPASATSGGDGVATATLKSTKAEPKSLSASIGAVPLGQASVTFKAGDVSTSGSTLALSSDRKSVV